MPATRPGGSRESTPRQVAAARDLVRQSRIAEGSVPAGALLIYDADCGFCQRSLAFGLRLLPWTPAAAGFQHVDLSRLGLTETQVRRSIQLYRPGRPTRSGAAAIAVILRAQPTLPWRVAGRVLATPPVSWIAAGCYRLVARYRLRLPGSTCASPTR